MLSDTTLTKCGSYGWGQWRNVICWKSRGQLGSELLACSLGRDDTHAPAQHQHQPPDLSRPRPGDSSQFHISHTVWSQLSQWCPWWNPSCQCRNIFIGRGKNIYEFVAKYLGFHLLNVTLSPFPKKKVECFPDEATTTTRSAIFTNSSSHDRIVAASTLQSGPAKAETHIDITT